VTQLILYPQLWGAFRHQQNLFHSVIFYYSYHKQALCCPNGYGDTVTRISTVSGE
jgi:hypothetical protein